MPKAKTKTVKKVVKQTQRQTAKQVAKQTVKVVIGDVSKKKKTVSRKKAGVKVPQVVYTAPMFAPQPQPLYPTFTPTIPSAPAVSYDIPVAPPAKKPVSQEEPKPVLPEAKVEHPVEMKAPITEMPKVKKERKRATTSSIETMPYYGSTTDTEEIRKAKQAMSDYEREQARIEAGRIKAGLLPPKKLPVLQFLPDSDEPSASSLSSKKSRGSAKMGVNVGSGTTRTITLTKLKGE